MHYDGGDPSKSINLTQLVAKEKGSQLYCCGPRGLMDALSDVVDLHGGSLLTEDFNPASARLTENSNDEDSLLSFCAPV